MRVVFVVHYFPPLNSSGSRRILSYVKYLARIGHKITVITTRKSVYDGDLCEIIPEFCKVIQLGALSKESTQETGLRAGSTSTAEYRRFLVLLRRRMTRIFGQLIDHRLFFALRLCLNKFPQDTRQEIVDSDLIVSSSPPWPVHLGAFCLSRKYNKPWIADYRDQFSDHYLFRSNFLVEAFERKLERLLLDQTSLVTVVSRPMADYYKKLHCNVQCIENGFDSEVFAKIKAEQEFATVTLKSRKTLRYVGTVTKSTIIEDYIPNLFEALRISGLEVREKISVQFFGESGILPSIVQKKYPELIDCVEFNKMVPYEEALTLICSSDSLFFSGISDVNSQSAKGVITTKLYEYLAARRPIVAEISDETLAGKIILKSGLGLVCSTDPVKIAKAMSRIVNGNISVMPNEEFIESFSRKDQVDKFEKLMLSTLEEFNK